MQKLLYILLLFIGLGAAAQNHPAPAHYNTKQLIAALDSFRTKLPVEKLYLQTDKPYYIIGDTLHFSAYLFNADFLTPSTQSKLLYVELDNSAGKCAKRIMVSAGSGMGRGDIALDEKEIPEGSYTLRAYTNWMRNFGDDYLFKKDIYIAALSNTTLVKSVFKLEEGADKDKVQANLRFTGLDKKPISLKDIQFKIMDGRHNLIKDKATTGMDGSIAINFDLADKTALKNLYIQMQQIGKGSDTAIITIPVTLNRAANTDVQFMPEGGYLVAGIPAKIGFKAIGENGMGTSVSGRIVDSKQQQAATFATLHAGMGSFELTPQAGEKYTAIVNLANGITKNYPLPAVDVTGTTLRITPKGDDSLLVTLNNTGSKTATNNNYYLIGQSRGVACYASMISFKGETIKKVISKTVFPSGIARFTLLNTTYQPLNERIIYIDHGDNLQINITASKPVYTPRDSIALKLQVTDKNGKPVQGRFSMAVTDDSQVRTDSTASNIINNLLLTADLKGTIEAPGWYFDLSDSKTIALDNLMLTQGWVGYDWKQVLDNKAQQIQYLPEKEFAIQGRMTNILNNGPGRQAIVLLMQVPHTKKTQQPYFKVADVPTDKKGYFNFTIPSDNEGRFILHKPFPTDSGTFKLVTIGMGRAANTGIQIINEFKPPVFTAGGLTTPWYVNSDTLLLNNADTKKAQQMAEANFRGEGRQLKEVLINEKKIVEGSKNLNGPGEADQVLNQTELAKAGKLTLYDLIRQKIKGFNTGTFNDITGTRTSYRIADKEIRLIIDGVDVDKVRPMPPTGNDRYNIIKEYMDNLTAEDIAGIELMFNARVNSLYARRFLTQAQLTSPDYPIKMDWAFIEVTTISGVGPTFKHSELMYLYKPITFTFPKQFYRPRYTVNSRNTAMGTDLRSTIHWEPDIITDTAGNATLSFYSADKPANYTLIMEGTDMNGVVGYRRERIKVLRSQK